MCTIDDAGIPEIKTTGISPFRTDPGLSVNKLFFHYREGTTMKKFAIWSSMIILAACQPADSDKGSSEVSLEVLNPRGEITLPPVSPPSMRIPDLKGKKIGLYWNEKPGGVHFWNSIELLLKEKLPDTTILRYSGAFDLGDVLAARIAGETDAFLYGVGD